MDRAILYVNPLTFPIAVERRLCLERNRPGENAAVHLREHGYFLEVPPVTAEIGDVVAGKAIGRERPDEVLVAINMGVAVEDVTTARRVYDLAVARGRGILLPL